MDDLISRKAVLDKFNRNSDMWNALMDEETSKEFWLFCRVADALDTIPSVPAVPLDKLCEWLAGNAWHLDCSNCDGEYYDCPQLYDDSGSSPEFWKAKLTKWMEEQDASPQ